MVKRATIIVAVICVVLAGILEPETPPSYFAASLFWVIVLWVLKLRLRPWLRRRASGRRRYLAALLGELTQHVPTPPLTPPAARARCPSENNKIVFATRADAQRAVENSEHRYAAGQVGTQLDHEYRCPHFDHWHVSSKPQRW